MSRFPEITRITATVWHGQYTIESPRTDMNLSDLLDQVIEPLLLAMGYSQSTIDELLQGDCEKE